MCQPLLGSGVNVWVLKVRSRENRANENLLCKYSNRPQYSNSDPHHISYQDALAMLLHLHFYSRYNTKGGKSEHMVIFFVYMETPHFWAVDASTNWIIGRGSRGWWLLSGTISCSLLWQISVSSWHHSMLRLTSNDGSGLCTYHRHQTAWQPFLTSRVVCVLKKLHDALCRATFNYPMYWLIAGCGISLLFASLTVVKLLDFASLSAQNGFFFRPFTTPHICHFSCQHTLKAGNLTQKMKRLTKCYASKGRILNGIFGHLNDIFCVWRVVFGVQDGVFAVFGN